MSQGYKRTESRVDFSESDLIPFYSTYRLSDYRMEVQLATHYALPFTNADGTVHYAGEDEEDTGTVTLLMQARGSYFDVHSMRRYLASLPWPKRARGSGAGGE